MTTQEALKLIEEKLMEDHSREKQRFLRGLQVLAKYDDDLRLSFEHDQCWVCDFEATVSKMTRDDVIELARCGWHENEESWTHY